MIYNNDDNNIRNNGNLVIDIPLGGPSCPLFPVELEFRVLVFVKGGRPKEPEKNPRSKDQNQQQTQPSYSCDVRSGIWIRATVEGGGRPHHSIIAPPRWCFGNFLAIVKFKDNLLLVLQHNVKRSKAKAMKHYKAHTRRSYVYLIYSYE